MLSLQNTFPLGVGYDSKVSEKFNTELGLRDTLAERVCLWANEAWKVNKRELFVWWGGLKHWARLTSDRGYILLLEFNILPWIWGLSFISLSALWARESENGSYPSKSVCKTGWLRGYKFGVFGALPSYIETIVYLRFYFSSSFLIISKSFFLIYYSRSFSRCSCS